MPALGFLLLNSSKVVLVLLLIRLRISRRLQLLCIMNDGLQFLILGFEVFYSRTGDCHTAHKVCGPYKSP